MSETKDSIDRFLSARKFAVAGASDDVEKFGHRCFAALFKGGYHVYPLNPKARTVLGVAAYPNLAALPEPIESLSIVTPPAVTERLIAEALAAGVQNIWMQPGAEPEHDASLKCARDAGVNLIYGGPCLLVELRHRGTQGTKAIIHG